MVQNFRSMALFATVRCSGICDKSIVTRRYATNLSRILFTKISTQGTLYFVYAIPVYIHTVH